MGYTTDGLPAGLQILARRYDEPDIFRIAYAYEQLTRHRRPPPGFGPLRQQETTAYHQTGILTVLRTR
jgi:hypothetical protein